MLRSVAHAGVQLLGAPMLKEKYRNESFSAGKCVLPVASTLSLKNRERREGPDTARALPEV